MPDGVEAGDSASAKRHQRRHDRAATLYGEDIATAAPGGGDLHHAAPGRRVREDIDRGAGELLSLARVDPFDERGGVSAVAGVLSPGGAQAAHLLARLEVLRQKSRW